jgi:hypothetical protein
MPPFVIHVMEATTLMAPIVFHVGLIARSASVPMIALLVIMVTYHFQANAYSVLSTVALASKGAVICASRAIHCCKMSVKGNVAMVITILKALKVVSVVGKIVNDATSSSARNVRKGISCL